jgi:hypothetical protein
MLSADIPELKGLTTQKFRFIRSKDRTIAIDIEYFADVYALYFR